MTREQTFYRLGTVLRKTERTVTKLEAMLDAEERFASLTDGEVAQLRMAHSRLVDAVDRLKLLTNRGSTPDRGAGK